MIKVRPPFLSGRVLFLSLLLTVFTVTNTLAQCSPNTSTTFSVDLSGSSDTTVSIQSTRNGNSCTGSNCITFNITLNPATNFVNFSVANPAPPGGAFYQINCGPQTSLGIPACISGMTNVCVSYCKPGNDNATYTITTTKGIQGSPDQTLRPGCTGTMSITGLQAATINWTSISPGTTGAYNNYLSCVTGCASTNVTPQVGAPAYIDYKVTGTKICGGVMSDTVRVYAMPQLSVAITPVNPIICGSGNVVLTASAAGGGGTYNYIWNTGQTTQSIIANSLGTYTVSVSDNTNCPGISQSITVAAAPLSPAPTINNNGPLCIGSTLNLSASTITGATYAWTGPNGFMSSVQNPVIPNTTLANAGTYTVTATINGCTSASGSTTVIINSIPPQPTATSNEPLCVGSTLNLTASAIAGASYLWTGPNGFASSLQNPVIPNTTLVNAGLYFVRAIVNGCMSAINSASVVINPVPAAPIVSNNGPVCVGLPVNLTANTITGATYTWTGPNGFISNLQNPVIANNAIADAGTFRTYNATVTVNGCTSVTSSTTVVVYPITTMPVASNNGALCVGSTLNLTASIITGATYSWTGPNGFTSNLQNPVINNITLLHAGIYNVTAALNGCASVAGSTTVVINPIPSASTAGNNGPLCIGSTLNLTANTITGAAYTWTGPNGFASNLQNPLVNNISSANAGTYNVTTIVNGCTSVPGTTTVVINPVPSIPIANNNGPVCVGSTLNLTANTITGATYNWSGPNNFISNLQNPIITTGTLSDAGIYDVTATVNGCTSSAASTTVVITSPSVSNAGIDQTVCATNNIINLMGTITGGNPTGIWTSSGTGNFSPGNTTLNTNYVLSGTDKANGSVTLTLTSANNGTCPASASSILITLTPAITINAGSDIQMCADVKSVNLAGQINSSGAIWTTNGTGTFSPDNKTLNAIYTLSPADKLKSDITFTLTSTGIVNCNVNSDEVKIIIKSLPSVNAGEDQYVLENQKITLHPLVAGINLTYLWTPNLYINNDIIKNPVVTGVNDQLYTIKVTDASGCSNEDQVFVKVLRSIVIPNTFTPNNDGINDTWIIKDLKDYAECRVQVFNRYGQLLFESKGYAKPWDGTYNGKSSPLGTYYYVIEPGNGVKPYTGYVTIIK